jgi:hypothetical protein
MKYRIYLFAFSMTLLFFFGASTFAQNKPDKKDTKTEQNVNQQAANNNLAVMSTNGNENHVITSKDKMYGEGTTEHHIIKHPKMDENRLKAYRAPEKKVDGQDKK